MSHRLAVQIHRWPPRDRPSHTAAARRSIRFYLTLGNNAAVQVFLSFRRRLTGRGRRAQASTSRREPALST